MKKELPSRKQCIQLLKKYQLKENMIEHSKAVEKIAVFLAKKFKEAGRKVDVELVSRAALLHDIDKFLTLNGKARHGSKAHEILSGEQLPELVDIVKEHILEQVLIGKFSSLESKIVYYTDKRVTHDQLCSIDERFDYLRKRYGRLSTVVMKRINKCYPKVKELEEELFSKIDANRELGELRELI